MKRDYLEEIEGDLEEVFQDQLEHMSPRRARRLYVWELLKLLRPVLLRNPEGTYRLTHYGMFKNYFKTSFRNLMKHPLNSFINVFGLSAAIGIAIFGYAFARWTYSTDQFHEHKHRVYLATFFANRDGTEQQYGTTPRPLGELLKEDFAQIRSVCRVEDRPVVIKQGDKVFHERVRFTDPAFLELFTFPLKWGSRASLADVNSIILSEDMAIKYFGEENPVGQQLLVKFSEERGKVFKVSGVAREFPEAKTIRFDFLVNLENLKVAEPAYSFHEWGAFVNATFIRVDDPADLEAIRQGMEKYRKLQNEAVQEDWAISSFGFEPLATLHERSGDIRDDISWSSADNYTTIIFIAAIAGLLLALACLNYINIAIVTATRRLKEIGIRKSIGATRKTVIVQFLTENVLMMLLALAVGLVLGMTFFIPGFERLWDFNMGFKLTDLSLWPYLAGVLLLTSLASGLYPSLYISRFQVVGILKGSVKFGTKNPLTKVFLSLQLTLACVFITISIVFTQNQHYLAERSRGYDHEQTLYAVVPDAAGFEKLSAQVVRDPEVVSVSGSVHHVGKSHQTTVLHFPDREYEVDHLVVGANYFGTMGLELKEGRLFGGEGGDRQSVVVNETFVETMAWKEPVGQSFRIDSINYEVIGVLKEFHSYSFFNPVRPTIFTVADKADFRYLSLQVRSGAEAETYRGLQEHWAALFPEVPFDGGFQEDTWGGYYRASNIYELVWRIFSFLVVALASLGLYGLVTLNVAGRVREFSIRKVLGAGLSHLAVNITGQYVVLFAVAVVIGAPLGFWAAETLLKMVYEYAMPMDFSGMIGSVVILVFILLATVSVQIRKVVRANPVEGLKMEG